MSKQIKTTAPQTGAFVVVTKDCNYHYCSKEDYLTAKESEEYSWELAYEADTQEECEFFIKENKKD